MRKRALLGFTVFATFVTAASFADEPYAVRGTEAPISACPAPQPPPLQLVYCPEPEDDCAWKFKVMPYLWAPSLEGTITSLGVPSQVDASFGDLLSSMKYAVIGQMELSRGRCFLLADTLLMKSTVDVAVDGTKTGPFGLVTVEGELDVSMSALTYFQELLAGYRIYEREICSCAGPRKFSFDLLAGIRYYLIDVDVTASAEVAVDGPRPGVRTRKASATLSGSEDWIDPVVGARMQYDITPKLAAIVKGDVGGFGVGSDLSWSASALAQYRFNPRWSVLAGYKILDIDYADGDAGMDARLAGPVAAITYEIQF